MWLVQITILTNHRPKIKLTFLQTIILEFGIDVITFFVCVQLEYKSYVRPKKVLDLTTLNYFCKNNEDQRVYFNLKPS